MRSGACSVQQALTTEAASVLKLSLNLARRRGHAQVTPLHVAATLLTSSSSSSNLLRRACLKSHPLHLASSHHPLQCRALELCFNVALNRLPTTPPPSSGSLIHCQPSLSNALIAALKRAQAHQRRGCIEQQQQHFSHHHHNQQQQQQQQPLLAIKVELEQLIISILDDPSVSRVMREAGFSSTTVKTNLEEDSSVSSSSSSSPLAASPFFFDSSRSEMITSASFLHTHFLKPSPEQNPFAHFSIKEDLKVVLDVMLKKQGKRCNTVVVGDSVPVAEGVISELMGRLEKGGEVPDELKSSHLIRLQLSHVHLRLMSRWEVDMKVSDLRRKVSCLNGGGVIVFVGDLRWALDEERRDDDVGFKPVEHLIDEIGKFVCEMKSSSSSSKVWLMASASYQTYMRCQVRHPTLEARWALQAVVVPSGGLKLSLQAPCSGLDSRATKLTQYPFQMLEPKALYQEEEEDKLNCCSECTANFEKEAKENNSGSPQLPSWLQPQKPDNHHKDTSLELRRKWNRLCRSLHPHRRSSIHVLPPYPSSHRPWWSDLLADNKNKSLMEPHSVSFAGSIPKLGNASPLPTSQTKNAACQKPWLSDVKTTLALGNALFSDTATSMDQWGEARVDQRELSRKLQENIPWQSETVPSIVEALLDCRSKNGTWVLVRGTDKVGKRRLARVVAESFCGSADSLVYINAKRSAGGVEEIAEAMRKDPKRVALIEDIDQASGGFIKTLSDCIKSGVLEDRPFGGDVELSQGVFILTTSSSSADLDSEDESHDRVLKMRVWVEETTTASDHKRKSSESDPPPLNEKMKKKMKPSEAEFELDLNICAEDSDLTHEMDGNNEVQLPSGLVESIGRPITLDEAAGGSRGIEEGIVNRLAAACDGQLSVDRAAMDGLMGAMGWFLEGEFERWVREVFELNLATVKKGGKVRVGVEGIEGNVGDCGFLGSVLPKRIHVE